MTSGSGIIQCPVKGMEASTTVVTTEAHGPPDRQIEITYSSLRPIGRGTFGAVYAARLPATNETVAIKKVLQDKRFKNRELQIMRVLSHQNVVKLKYFFYSSGDHKDQLFLNLILEYVPETIYKVGCHYQRQSLAVPTIYVKLFLYQLFRALNYIHGIGYCHRDIKPQNLLIFPETGVLKLCDFGSAKHLVKGEPNVSYICSRYYRAPELILGSPDYTTAIDVWSAGTVLGELILGQPLFPGASGVDQLAEIVRILGTPSTELLIEMHRPYGEYRFPHIPPHPWETVFRHNATKELLDLIGQLVQYSPKSRPRAIVASNHPYFHQLRVPGTKLPNGKPLPPLEMDPTTQAAGGASS
ncbi:unnamed protein product, partial [Mesorhabditis spiculigera]